MPNLLSYEDQSPYSLSAQICLITFAVIFVSLRVFVKVKLVRLWGYEDYAILFALLCSIVAAVLFFIEERISDGNYNLVSALITTDIPTRLKYVYAINIIYNLSVTAVKLSFLLLYLRIFRQRSMRIVIWTVFGIVIIYSCWALFSNIFFCWPIDEFWNAVVPFESEKCLDTFHIFLSQAVLNTATDLLLIILPLPCLRHLMLPRGQKIALVLVFLLGSFICIASILRMLAFIRAFGDGTYNLVWAGRSVAIWTAIEMNIAIICACLPPLRLLIMHFFSSTTKLGKSVNRSRSVISSKIMNVGRTISMEKLQGSRDGDGEEQLSSRIGSSEEGIMPASGKGTQSRNKICVTTVHTVDYDDDDNIGTGLDPSKSDAWAGRAV